MASAYLGPNTYGISFNVGDAGFYVLTDANGYYVGAVGHEVSASGSPTTIMLDTVSVNLGDVYQAVRAKLGI